MDPQFPDSLAQPAAATFSPARPRPWTWLEGAGLIAFSLAALIAVMLVGGAFHLLLSQAFGVDLLTEVGTGYVALAVAIQLVFSALVALALYYIVTVRCGYDFLEGMSWRQTAAPDAAWILGGLALMISVGVFGKLIGVPETTPFQELLEGGTASIVLLGLFGTLVAPLIEELVFRGFFYALLERTAGAVAAVGLTSGVFSVLHGSQYGWSWEILALLFYVGVVFGVVRWRTGSVRATTFLHAAYNGLQVLALLWLGDEAFVDKI